MKREKVLSLLLMIALFGAPLSIVAEEGIPLEEPVVEEAEQEMLVIEEGIGEILATSTEAVIDEEPIQMEADEIEASFVEEVEVIDPSTYVEGEVIVKFEGEDEAILVQTNDVEELIEELSEDPAVEYAEPNYIRSISVLSSTTDPYAEELWGLAKIQTDEAWDFSMGEEVIVAVIDTGIDYTHQELAGRMWDGNNCVGVDALGNPINGGCQHGFDFVDNDYDPISEDGFKSYHGTHVAGTIAANFNNQIGVVGVAPKVKIMALRIMDNNGTGSVVQGIAAIKFATANGAKIINASYSGSGEHAGEKEAIENFQNAGGLLIAAASNNGTDGDITPAYPANYTLSGIISVAATDQNDLLAPFSNYGKNSVDLGAPGVAIQSIEPNNPFGVRTLEGTSMAAPHVTGAVALIKAFRPALGASDVKSLILNEGDTVAALSGKTVSGKRLNAYETLLAAEALTADTTPPVITIIGDNPLELIVGETFTDAGATAEDETDGDRTAHITTEGTVDTAIAGSYPITYRVSDLSGNAASATRTVIVSNPPAPEEPTPEPKPKKRRSGGGGGGGSKSDNPERTPQVLGNSTALTPEVQAQIAYLTALVQKLLALIAAMKAAGMT